MKSLLLGTLCLFASLAACSSDGEQAPPAEARQYRGAVHIVVDSGTRRHALEMAEGYPQLELSNRFRLHVVGVAADQQHEILLTIDPLKQVPNYEFPDERADLVAQMVTDDQPASIGAVSGFLRIKSRDEGDQLGSAVCSIALSASGGFVIAELDMTFSM